MELNERNEKEKKIIIWNKSFNAVIYKAHVTLRLYLHAKK